MVVKNDEDEYYIEYSELSVKSTCTPSQIKPIIRYVYISKSTDIEFPVCLLFISLDLVQ